MPRAINIAGETYGRLTVIAAAAPLGRARAWHCRCSCGRQVVVRGSDMRQGKHLSCGCLQAERTSAANKRHGQSSTRLYWVWGSMIQRCTDEKCKSFANYGARGVTVCDRWMGSFEAFASDVGEKPGPGYSIDRINNDGNYEPGNVKWSTPEEQRRNQRNTRLERAMPRYREMVRAREQGKTAAQVAQIFGVSEHTVTVASRKVGFEMPEAVRKAWRQRQSARMSRMNEIRYGRELEE